jgi:hypothetical protein
MKPNQNSFPSVDFWHLSACPNAIPDINTRKLAMKRITLI